MMRRIYIVSMNLLLVMLLSACTESLFDENTPLSSELPVTLSSEYPSWTSATRAGADIVIPEKKKFEEGEVIHVIGSFTLKGDKGTVNRYGTFRYSSGKWVPNGEENSWLRWPWNAENGSFAAYYVAGTDATLPEGGSFVGYLGGDETVNDPLTAKVENVKNGYAVNFQFEHLCTRLIILNTKNNYAEEYWFGRTNPAISNAYSLKYNPQPTDPAEPTDPLADLCFSFMNDNTKNDGYISTLKVLPTQGDGTTNSGYVVLYLEPGKYKNSELNYSGNRLYLSLNVDALDTPTSGIEGLQAGQSYVLDIKQASGIIDKEAEDDPWNNPDPPVSDFDIDTFINSIANGVEYEGFLEFDNAGNLKLMKNLDFEGKDYTPKNVPSNITLDGNYHYIANNKHSLFFQVQGNVRNLEIRETKIDNFSPSADGKEGYRTAALARDNSGDIDNVRLKDISISVPGLIGTDRVTTVGGLVAEQNAGHVSNIYIIGTHKLEVKDPEGGRINGRVFLGGVIGQATSGASISNIFMKQDELGNEPDIDIVLKSNGECTAAVGGVAGAVAVSMENCTYSANINCSSSIVLGCGVGGLFGRELSNNNTPAYTIKNCNVTGAVYGPFCSSNVQAGGTSNGRSSVGGIGGGVQGANVTFDNCSSFCEVFDYFYASEENKDKNVGDEHCVYATGSAFGRFTSGNASNQIKNCTAWGKVNAKSLGSQSYIGSLIGYTKKVYTNSTTNRVNTTANNGLDVYGGVFDGTD